MNTQTVLVAMLLAAAALTACGNSVSVDDRSRPLLREIASSPEDPWNSFQADFREIYFSEGIPDHEVTWHVDYRNPQEWTATVTAAKTYDAIQADGTREYRHLPVGTIFSLKDGVHTSQLGDEPEIVDTDRPERGLAINAWFQPRYSVWEVAEEEEDVVVVEDSERQATIRVALLATSGMPLGLLETDAGKPVMRAHLLRLIDDEAGDQELPNPTEIQEILSR